MGNAGRVLVAVALLCPATASAQTTQPPDLNGLWLGPSGAESRLLTGLFGKELPLTPYGLERTKKLDVARDPFAVCFPMGPTRGYNLLPFQIVQSKDLVVILFEFQRTYSRS